MDREKMFGEIFREFGKGILESDPGFMISCMRDLSFEPTDMTVLESVMRNDRRGLREFLEGYPGRIDAAVRRINSRTAIDPGVLLAVLTDLGAALNGGVRTGGDACPEAVMPSSVPVQQPSSVPVQQPSVPGKTVHVDGMPYGGGMYTGDTVGGLPSGNGRLVYRNGDTFEGRFFEGKRSRGRFEWGKYTKHSGCVYDGDFIEDGFTGRGVLITPSGKYEGFLADGQFEGSGIYSYADGTVYEGSFSKGRFEGRGFLTYANGNRYEGEFKKGKFHGQGRFTYRDGTVYEGEFRLGLFHGPGEYRRGRDGRGYRGGFSRGKCTTGVYW